MSVAQDPSCFPPRWDGRRVLFDVISQGERVTCAISVNALQDLSDRRRFRPADLVQGFGAVRDKVEAIALAKLSRRAPGATGLLHIWTDDVDDSRAGAAAGI